MPMNSNDANNEGFIFPHPDTPDVEWSKGAFDIEGYIRDLDWSPDTTEHVRTLVAGNLRTLFSVLRQKHNAAVREAGRIERDLAVALSTTQASAPSARAVAENLASSIRSQKLGKGYADRYYEHAAELCEAKAASLPSEKPAISKTDALLRRIQQDLLDRAEEGVVAIGSSLWADLCDYLAAAPSCNGNEESQG